MSPISATSLQSVSLFRYRNGELSPSDDVLAVEEPLQIRIREGQKTRSLAITMRTPGEDEALALGFLFSEGIIQSPDQILAAERASTRNTTSRNTLIISLAASCPVDWARLQRHSYTSSSCGVCGKTSIEQLEAALPFGEMPGRWSINSSIIPRLPDTLRRAQRLFEQTGGIHAAGLFTPGGKLLHFAEDVGRHNAMDKVVGNAFRAGELPLRQRILVLSGRASFELLQKAAMAGISFVVSVGAPSSLAVTLAEEQSITLCGFVREGGFNCYSHPERIVK
ncbi:formate dehydrogenase accessory sulfurtransferase FdhD [Neolewinella agarilytica]|uniref:formate dehydrogenase accessory sulfurtransferase FdhD n=1 Tax=Neolewinella agarilytica TaxID=478744 RepID=UPI002353F5A5|nr:formate dehydrogenase accessory sulfurtransferase FdhD [Neolewinella agarilytica]